MNIEIDFVVEPGQTPEQALEAMLKGHDGLIASVTSQGGPTGWPVARVSGSTDAVVAFADAYEYEV